MPDRFRPAIVDADGNLDWRRQLDLGFDLIDAQSVGSLAACLVEPILSSGGVVDLPPGYLAALRDKCHERGMLLIVDEAQTGLCRTGDWYAFQRDGVVPGHPHALQDPRRRAAAGRRADQRRDRAARPTSAGSCSSPRTPTTRCPPPSATPSWTC